MGNQVKGMGLAVAGESEAAVVVLAEARAAWRAIGGRIVIPHIAAPLADLKGLWHRNL